MAITSPVSLRAIGQEEFAKIDYEVMHHAFESHNELGRLCDEVIYQNDLAGRLRSAGVSIVRTEVPVTVTHRHFTKKYFLDLVVGDAAIYELKTAAGLCGEHDAQLLNYLCLRGVHHGKLVNFRPARVESKFINTNLTPERRHKIEFDTADWHELDEGSRILRSIMTELLEDWGGFLDLGLYAEALVHFLGGEGRVNGFLPLSSNGVSLGNQAFLLVSPDTAFRLTGISEDRAAYAEQLSSLIRLTPLRAIQWINLSKHKVEFKTISQRS